MRILLALASLILFAVPAHATKAPQTDFADYPVKAAPFEAAEAADVTDELAWRYRAELVKGFESAANYAGKYVVIPVSCGAQCQMNWIVDKSTGDTVDVIDSAFGAQYRIDSALLVVNGAQSKPELNLPTKFYLIKNGKMVMIHETGMPYPVPEDIPQGVEIEISNEVCNPKKSGLERCPHDIDNFLNMLSECNHWAGEEPYDNARRKEIDDNLKDLNCAALPCGYAGLIRKYKGQEKSLHLIQSSVTEISGDDPVEYGDRCARNKAGG